MEIDPPNKRLLHAGARATAVHEVPNVGARGVMKGAHIDCGKQITDSLIRKNGEIIDSNQFVPKGHKFILGDMATVTL